MRKILLIVAVLGLIIWWMRGKKTTGTSVGSVIDNPASSAPSPRLSIPNVATIKSVIAAPQPVVSVMPEASDPVGSKRLTVAVSESNAMFFKVGDRIKLIDSQCYPMVYTIVKDYALFEDYALLDWHCFVLNTLYVRGEILKIVKA